MGIGELRKFCETGTDLLKALISSLLFSWYEKCFDHWSILSWCYCDSDYILLKKLTAHHAGNVGNNDPSVCWSCCWCKNVHHPLTVIFLKDIEHSVIKNNFGHNVLHVTYEQSWACMDGILILYAESVWQVQWFTSWVHRTSNECYPNSFNIFWGSNCWNTTKRFLFIRDPILWKFLGYLSIVLWLGNSPCRLLLGCHRKRCWVSTKNSPLET